MGFIRTGILGGSFNPIHNAHIAIAQAMVSAGIVDEVWLMVSPQNPLKSSQTLLPEEKRYQMACMACKGLERICASDFEFHLPRPTYTWTTLCALSKMYANHTFTLLIGSDNWTTFHKWRRFKDIIDNYRIAIYPRPGYEVNEKDLPQNVMFANMPISNISSTMIRQKIINGEDFSSLLHKDVYNLIVKEKLYM